MPYYLNYHDLTQQISAKCSHLGLMYLCVLRPAFISHLMSSGTLVHICSETVMIYVLVTWDSGLYCVFLPTINANLQNMTLYLFQTKHKHFGKHTKHCRKYYRTSNLFIISMTCSMDFVRDELYYMKEVICFSISCVLLRPRNVHSRSYRCYLTSLQLLYQWCYHLFLFVKLEHYVFCKNSPLL